MLLKADAFGSDKWSVRISLANLATNQYSEVGKRMIRLSEHIKEEWLRQKRQAIKTLSLLSCRRLSVFVYYLFIFPSVLVYKCLLH